MIEFTIKTPQLIGIILGCVVFTITIAVVIYLLIASGALKSVVDVGKNIENVSLSKFPFNDYPKLYDELLEARQTLPTKPVIPDITGNKVILSELKESFLDGLILCSNGNAIFSESKYDPSIIWKWMEDSYQAPKE